MAMPTKDQELVPYSINFDTQLSSSGATVYHIAAGDVTQYTTLRKAYTDSWDALVEAREAGVRSAVMTAAKDTAKAVFLPFARKIYGQIAADPTIPAPAKVEIGVHVKKEPTPVPPLTVRPGLDVKSVFGSMITIGIHDSENMTKRAKPQNALYAYVYSHVGATYPSDPTLWSFHGSATKDTFDVVLPDSVPAGSQVWICAAWVSRRGIAGPPSIPVSTYTQGGMLKAA